MSTALQAVYEFADYVTINISSPNTQGLRQLQEGEQLRPLLQALLRDARRVGGARGLARAAGGEAVAGPVGR